MRRRGKRGGPQRVGAVPQPRVDALALAHLFDDFETGFAPEGGHGCGGEEAAPRLTLFRGDRRDGFGVAVSGRVPQFRGKQVIGHDFRSGCQTAEIRQCGENRLPRQVHGDTQPADEHGAKRVESTLDEPFPERTGLEVDRDEGDRSGHDDAGALEQFSFGGLGRRPVDLEHPESRGRVPIGERIQPGAQNHILVYTGIGAKEPVFGEPAAAHRLGAGAGQDGMGTVEVVIGQEFLGALAEEGRGEGVGEDDRLSVEEQMRRSCG